MIKKALIKRNYTETAQKGRCAIMLDYSQTTLFKDISMDDYQRLLSCLEAREKRFDAGETICSYDSGFGDLGIIGAGTACVVRYEFNGARTILERLGPQDIFGRMLSYDCREQAGVNVVCETPCSILFLKYRCISATCTKACAHHHQLIQNLLNLISERALSLSRRVEVLSQRTIREKLMCYFYQLSSQAMSPSFPLPFSMVDLADYLSIDRSAMTRELKRMKDEGLLRLDKRQVWLLA